MFTRNKKVLLGKGMNVNTELSKFIQEQMNKRLPIMDDYDAGFVDCLKKLEEQLAWELSLSQADQD